MSEQSKRPVVFIVMDGVGIRTDPYGNAVAAANKPVLDRLLAECPSLLLKAHGTAVGLPSDEDMGNSEVGHNALGSGQIYDQGAKLVNKSIETGALFASPTWRELVGNCVSKKSTLHFIGLLSDGNVHSNISHLKAMLAEAKKQGVGRARVHILLDGRDVEATSALVYVKDLEDHLASLRCATFDAAIASGGGRMKITMDRYEADWEMVRLGWATHVLGEGPLFASAAEAIEVYRKETGSIDQDLPPFVVEGADGKPAGPILDGDSVIFFNFRGDRALEISRAFDEDAFDRFDRVRRPAVLYAGMLQYDGDLKIPARFLVAPPAIRNTLSETLIAAGIRQYALSETQKYGHVTYFWNGNRNEKFSETMETFVEIPSDRVSFDQRPWMKSADIADTLIGAIRSGRYGFLRVNFPNGDMVGHTGVFQAAQVAVESVDIALGRILKAVDEAGGIALITADHGNADEMYEKPKKPGAPPVPKTAHTLNPVPFIVYDPKVRRTLKEGAFGLANASATVATLLGVKAPDCWEESML
jgi:2,3-bisphosphoglycerate-independent phosphoglycerate mutase